jgi:hypothetical protein
MSKHAPAPATGEMPPEAILIQIQFGALMAQALSVAAELKIADLLSNGPKTVKELAAATGSHERSLYRVLRSLASTGVFREVADQVFTQTPQSEPLRSDAPISMRNGAIFMGAPWHWQVWGDLRYSVKTGQPAWGHQHGGEVFDFFAKNPEASEIFNNAMTDMSVSSAQPIVDAYDFSGIKTVADIGGGHGYFLAQILKANPNVQGILYDMQHVIEGASTILAEEGVAERTTTIAGSFFDSVPAGADVYVMKHIIHDWDDERCVKILSNIREAMSSDGRVLTCEVVVPEGNDPHFSKVMDLEMLVSPGGVERTEAEYRELYAAAGLKLNRIIPTASAYSIIEGVKQ